MNKLLDAISDLDPDYARKEKWRMRAFALAVPTALVAVALGVYSTVVNVGQDAHITRIEKTPCNEDPSGSECAELRLGVAKAEPLENPCVSYQRVTGEKGKNCKRVYVPLSGEPAPAVAPEREGVVPQQPSSTAPQEPGPGVGRGDGRSERPVPPTPQVPKPAAPQASQPATVVAAPPAPQPAPRPSAPAPGPKPQPPAPVREIVGGVSESVNDIVCDLPAQAPLCRP